jgi:hypothetical protein
MNLNETQIQLFGLAMIFYAVVTLGFNSFFDLIVSEAGKNIDAPIMKLEFVRKAKDIAAITASKPEAQNGLKTFLLFDAFAFVPLYLAFLFLMSFFLSQTAFDWAKMAAGIVVFISVLAALADWTENYYSYKALETVFADSEESVGTIFWAAHVKWISLFVATAILSAIFWRGGWWNIAAIALLAASVTALLGLIFHHPLIVLSLAVQLLILLIVGVAFMFSTCRQNFLQNH